MKIAAKFIKKHKIEIILFAGIIITYFILRLIKILDVPIFTDEAIYTRWTQIAKQDSTERFISLTDGKQPLFVWINIVFMKFIHDPLLSGRLVSTVAGFFSMIGLFFLSRELFKKTWIGIATMFLYLIYPMALVYDRLAIYDDLVATFYIWGLYFSILVVKRMRLDLAFILGFVLGGAALNKIGIFSIYLLPFNVLLFNFKVKQKVKQLGKLVVFFAIAFVIEEAMYSILRLSAWFYIIQQKNNTFFYPLSDLLHMPLSFWVNNFLGNFHGLSSWIIPYMTWPILLLALASGIFYKEFWKEKLLLFMYFIVPFVGFAVIAKVMYPRYIFFMSLALLPLVGYMFYKIHERIKTLYAFLIVGLVLISLMLYADFYILTNFAKAPIPQSDLHQYVNDWPAGGGVNEAVAFFQQQAQSQKIYVGTEGTFGLMPYALQIYLIDNPNITIEGIWPIKDTPPQSVVSASKKMSTYVLFYQPCPSCKNSGDAPITWPVTLVKRYSKGIGKVSLSIYQIK